MSNEGMDALGRLQASPPSPGSNVSAWLDARKEDVLTLIKDKGYSMTGELIGVSFSTIASWAHRRGLGGLGPGYTRSPAYRKSRGQLKTALAIQTPLTELAPIPPLLALEMVDLAARGNAALAYRRLLEHLLGVKGGQ